MVPASAQNEDYARIRAAIAFVAAARRTQPSVEEIAAAIGLSAPRLRELFQRWAGVPPKTFLQALTLDHARTLLRARASVQETAFEVGLSGAGRLHDLFVTHEALSPGEYRARGAGLTMEYGFHPSPFGETIAVVAPRGLAGLGWVDATRAAALEDMRRRWPNARFQEAPQTSAPYVARVFDPAQWRADQPLRIVLIGADFELRVWETLLGVPFGAATTYSDLACAVGRPRAARAVGAAVGRNPLSFVVPCHRVLAKSGALTGYHWGLPRKQAILGWEAARLA